MRITKFRHFLFFVGLFLACFFPTLPILFFAPYLVAICYCSSLQALLLRALGCGAIIDLLSGSHTFGLFSLSYLCATILVYLQRRQFFADKLSTLPILTYIFSVYLSLFCLILSPFFGLSASLSARVAITEMFIMPLCDCLFAGILIFVSFNLNKRYQT